MMNYYTKLTVYIVLLFPFWSKTAATSNYGVSIRDPVCCSSGKVENLPLVSCRLVWYSKEKGKPQKRPAPSKTNKLSRYKRQAVNYSR